jgi:hypothetical protein
VFCTYGPIGHLLNAVVAGDGGVSLGGSAARAVITKLSATSTATDVVLVMAFICFSLHLLPWWGLMAVISTSGIDICSISRLLCHGFFRPSCILDVHFSPLQ